MLVFISGKTENVLIFSINRRYAAMTPENDLGKGEIRKLVWRIAIPSMLAQFVNVLYSIVDRMYIGNIKEAGGLALAGVGVCGPVVTMIGSVAFLVGIGGAPLMSIRMGEGKIEEAKKIVANCFLTLCVFAAVLTAVVIPLRQPMLTLFGASGNIYPYADAYFTVYVSGTVFALLSTGMNQFIIAQGFAKRGMFSVLLGAILNIILDPIFIFALNMGVRGGAIATVISQAASAAYVLFFLFGKKVTIKISFGGYSMKIIRRVLLLGLSPFLIIALDNVMIIAMNAVLQKYGGPDSGDQLITCATIAQSFMLVVTMPLGGISGGTQTILSYNYGAGQTLRVKKAQKYIFALCTGYTTLMFAVSFLASPLFVRLFTSDPELAKEAVNTIKICTAAIIPLGIQYPIVDGFTALGQVKYSFPLSCWRKLVYFLCVFILPPFLGAKSVFLAEPISDVLGPIVSITVQAIAMKKVLAKRT